MHSVRSLDIVVQYYVLVLHYSTKYSVCLNRLKIVWKSLQYKFMVISKVWQIRVYGRDLPTIFLYILEPSDNIS